MARVGKPGRGDSIKHFSMYMHLYYDCIICRVGLYSELLYAIVPTLFPYFLPLCYILLYFIIIFTLVVFMRCVEIPYDGVLVHKGLQVRFRTSLFLTSQLDELVKVVFDAI